MKENKHVTFNMGSGLQVPDEQDEWDNEHINSSAEEAQNLQFNKSIIAGVSDFTMVVNKTAELKRGGSVRFLSPLPLQKKIQRSKSVVPEKDEKRSSSDNTYMEALTKGFGYKSLGGQISVFAKNTSSLRNLLNTSKGRDKFCQLL